MADTEPGIATLRRELAELHEDHSALAGRMAALDASQAVIEFEPDGTIIHANANFLDAMGYAHDEVVGQHHRMFTDSAYATSPEYRQFWQRLGRGESFRAEFKRLARGGREIWIQASYNPLKDAEGRVVRVIKFATDITDQKRQAAYFESQLQAIGKLQGVIEFELDGTIIDANENFLRVMGYTLEEIKGRHHRMFADPAYAASPAYAAFWEQLRRGEYDTGEYRRIAKGGNEVWISATYNPIFDMNGKPFRVVKFARDITAQKNTEYEIAGLIEAAAAGDLERRLETTLPEGFIRNLTERVNELLDAIAAPISDTVEVVEALAAGDLTTSMKGDYRGEFASLRDAVNGTVTNLERMVLDIVASGELIAHGSREISEGNRDLSSRTEQQASSLEQTAASMAELTETVKQSAENAGMARDISRMARDQAEEGGVVVERAIAAMENINESSSRIADIIGVIDEIAFQTNLLALNAAVEAARAGDQGRGFAVVASEVRSLAQRSADSAKEIKGLIKDSVQRVAEGSELVNESGSSLREIVSAVKKVTDVVGEISSAAKEQAEGIEQVNAAVAQMDDVTQQNAALVEQASAASESLDEQAVSLRQLMQSFKLSRSAAIEEQGKAAIRDRRDPRSIGSVLRAPVTERPSAPGRDRGPWEAF